MIMMIMIYIIKKNLSKIFKRIILLKPVRPEEDLA